MVEVVGSHNHIPVSNIEGVGSVPPPLSQSPTRMALADCSGNKQIISLKPATRM